MFRYTAFTTKGRTRNASSHRVWAGSPSLGVVKSRVVKSPRSHGRSTLAVPEPRIVEFYAH